MQTKRTKRAWGLLVCGLLVVLVAGCGSPSRKGGYYQDDGPGDHTPAGLLNTPDAQPRDEPLLPRSNRPYTALGKKFVPITDNRPYKKQGIGSWYGKQFHGNKTSSGEIYDMYKMTAAHPVLPIPSYARVTNLDNGKQVIVRINDRGPFHAGRIIDLSYTAALKLGYIGQGSGRVEVERVFAGDKPHAAETKPAASPARQASAPTEMPPGAPGSPAPASIGPSSGSSAGGQTGYYLQLGAFSQRDNAEALRRRYALEGSAVDIVRSGTYYRLMAGPFPTREKAMQAAETLIQAGAKPIIVQR